MECATSSAKRSLSLFQMLSVGYLAAITIVATPTATALLVITCFGEKCSALTLPANQELLAIHSKGFDSFLYRIDPELGIAAEIGQIPFEGLQSLAVSSSGDLYSWSYDAGLIIIDPETALATDVSLDTGGDPSGTFQSLAFSPNGELFGVKTITAGSPERHALFKIDVSTGVPNLVGTSPFFPAILQESLRGIEFVGEQLVGVTWSNNQTAQSFVQIDPLTGGVTYVGSTGAANMNSLSQDADGVLFTVQSIIGQSPQSTLFAFDPITGVVTDQMPIAQPAFPSIGTHGFTVVATVVRTLTGSCGVVAGDFNGDGHVNGADLLLWQHSGAANSVRAEKLTLWQNNFGALAASNSTAVPESATIIQLASALSLTFFDRRITFHTGKSHSSRNGPRLAAADNPATYIE